MPCAGETSGVKPGDGAGCEAIPSFLCTGYGTLELYREPAGSTGYGKPEITAAVNYRKNTGNERDMEK